MATIPLSDNDKKLLRALREQRLLAKNDEKEIAKYMQDNSCDFQMAVYSLKPEITETPVWQENADSGTILQLNKDYDAHKPHSAITMTDAPIQESGTELDLTIQPHSFQDGKELGRGGMGRVITSYQSDLERDVVIKETLSKKPEAIARFIREAKIVAKLEHPNIVPVHELHIDSNGNPRLVMKKVKGETLETIIDDSPRGTKELLHIFVKACEGVAYAHSQGVMHRDLKPENIMVGDQGEVYVMDMGLAKEKGQQEIRAGKQENKTQKSTRVQANSNLTADDVTMGTPKYMSPEQAEGKPTFASDIWSMGAILYKIATKTDAFYGATAVNVLARIAQGDFTKPREISPEIPPELESIILKALKTELEERYQSVEELKNDVLAYINGEQVNAHKYGIREKLSRWRKKHPRALAGAATLLFAAAIAGPIIGTIQANSERNERLATQAQLEAEKADKEKIQAKAELADRVQAELEKTKRESKAREHLFFGERALKRGNLELAMTELEKAQTLNPEDPETYFLTGLAKYSTLQGRAAIEDFTKANDLLITSTKTQDTKSLFYATMTYLDINDDVPNAVTLAKQTLANSTTEDSYILLLKSITAFGEEDYKKAVSHAEKSLEKDSKSIEAMYLLSQYTSEGINGSFNKTGLRPFRNYQTSITHIKNALRIEPNHVRLKMQAARLFAYTGQNDEATAHIEDLLKIKPIQELFTLKAVCQSNQGKHAEVIDTINTAEQYGKLTAHNYSARGIAYFKLGKHSQSLQDLNDSIKTQPTPAAYMYRGIVQMSLNNLEDALKDENDALKLNPEYNYAYFVRAEIKEKKQEYDSAVTDFEKAGQLNFPLGYYRAGKLHIQQGKKDEAIRTLKAYIATNHTQLREQVLNLLKELEK